jgi:RecA-family ATPase
MIMVRDIGRGPEMMEGNIRLCIDYIKANGITLFCVDPFVRAHQCDENDNMAIDRVAQAFTRIASETGCAVHLVHHTRKRANGAGGEGDMDTARGASSLVSAARIAHTLCGMSEKEGEKRGMPKGGHKWWVRLDDAKANLAPPQDKERWFKKHGENIGGESVGVLVLEDPAEIQKVEPKKGSKADF